MMKTLCVAVVVLSLTSVCQPASLACEQLLKPVDKAPDLLGSWHVVAISTDHCLVSTLLNAVVWPSMEVDITSKGTPNFYNATTKFKAYGYCTTEVEYFLYENNTMFDVDFKNVLSGEREVLLQSGCPDCIVLKTDGDEIIDSLLLLSRREKVTAEELTEFEAQAKCLGWSKPQVLNTDHDYKNCQSIDLVDTDSSGLSSLMFERLKATYTVPLQCLADTFLSYLSSVFGGAEQK